jgi:hypothetical protein
VALVRETVAESRFPFSDRIRVLRVALKKLSHRDSVPRPKPTWPPLPSGPMVGSGGKRGGKAMPLECDSPGSCG